MKACTPNKSNNCAIFIEEYILHGAGFSPGNRWHVFRKNLCMKRVLIVDDEIDLCLMIKLFLTKKKLRGSHSTYLI